MSIINSPHYVIKICFCNIYIIHMTDNIYSISTSDVCPKNEQDKKCAPGKKFEHGSCIRLEILVQMTNAYNGEFPDDAIKLDNKEEILHPHKYKKYLVNEFNKRLKNKCTTQKCWTQQNFIKKVPKIAHEELQKYTWRPYGPETGSEWLSTINIDGVMKQYEKIYPEFKFIGAVPRDCREHGFCPNETMEYNEIWEDGKTKIGIIYNTDPVGKSGEHWNALFADLKKGEIYFFDSYGVSPNSDVIKTIKILEKFIREKCNDTTSVDRNKNNLCKKVKLEHNDTRHQYEGSECGVYSISFILRMLKGKETFAEICASKIPDKTINKCRKVYFTKEKRKR
jgi:Ulp1 protease family, C-terminal catalytic domain